MNKKDLLPVILLALLIPLWMFIDRTFIAPKFPVPEPVPAAETLPPSDEKPATETSFSEDKTLQETATPVVEVQVAEEEIVETLQNEDILLELTSVGGGIKSATLLGYPELNKKDSPPVVLDFSNSTALAYEGLSGMSSIDSLHIDKSADGNSVVFTKTWNSGLMFQRTLTLDKHYLVVIKDRFINGSADPWNIPAVRIKTGYMGNPADTQSMKGLSILGVDSFTPEGGVNYWGRKLNKLFKNAGKPAMIDAVPEDMYNQPIDWVSAKNKFFTQILSPAEPIATMSILANRDMQEKGIVPQQIAATLDFQPVSVDAGQALERDYTYFVGPKNYSILKETGNHMEKVMEFETTGFWSFMNWMMEPARRLLLWGLNVLNALFHNYGIAIIMLTIIIRVLFWPLTHKSTEKMRENSEKMQVVQPKIKALQEKYKNNPRQLQQETMKVYQEHGFNPMGMMGGCLPLMLQMPVLFALFTVLRNAIELRYADFLWIADLSQPENLLAGSIPFVGSLNILPLIMSASMVWQQKLTTPSTAATPEQQQQQKMMMIMMPIMMLFFFYSMPSGLVLYFSVSNISMIAQTGIRNLRKKMKEA